MPRITFTRKCGRSSATRNPETWPSELTERAVAQRPRHAPAPEPLLLMDLHEEPLRRGRVDGETTEGKHLILRGDRVVVELDRAHDHVLVRAIRIEEHEALGFR